MTPLPPPPRRRSLPALAAAVLVLGLSGASGAQTTSSSVQTAPAPSAAQPSPGQPPAQAPTPAAAASATGSGPTAPAAPSPAQPPALDQIQAQAEATGQDAKLAVLGAQAASVEALARAAVAQQTQSLAGVNARLKRYATRPRRLLTETERRDEAMLTRQRASIRAALTQAQAQAADASSVFNLIAERRRNEFSARVFTRTASPISPDFWTSLVDTSGQDMTRLGAAARDAADTAFYADEPKGLIGLAFGLLVAAALAFPVRKSLEALVRRGKARSDKRYVRTAEALWLATVNTVTPGLAAIVLRLSAQWGGLLSEKADALAHSAVVAITWAAAILALGRALATDVEPDRRLLDLPHPVSSRVRFSLWAVAIVTAAGFLLTRLNYVVGASVAATIAANCLVSTAYALVAALILISGGAPQPATDVTDDESPHSSVWTVMSIVLTLAIIATLGADLAGYTTLAALISSQLFWLSVLGAATYLLLRFVDEACQAMFARRGWAGWTLARLFGLRATTIAQIGVLVAAALQLLLVVAAATLALTPFGQSGELLLANLSRLGQPIQIGTAVISPSAIATGLISLVIGLLLVRVARTWVVRRYLPATGWDPGLSNSVATGVGYLGVTLAVLCAMGAMGLSFQQLTLIASALSVGIGFGLQQIIQNFVSGLIMLVERPVKVGDWVKVDAFEGDVRRIRVRATEIVVGDGSTVLVPNSDFITKPLQNKTLGRARGQVQMTLSIADPSQAKLAADLMLQAFAEAPGLLKDSPPGVFIDSVVNGGVNFNAVAVVANPRDAYTLRSALYFKILEAFQQHQIRLLTVPPVQAGAP